MKHEHFWVMCAATSAALALIVGAAGAALAEPPGSATVIGQRFEEGLSKAVSYRDLNLASLAGEQTLNRRVGGAARAVCEPVGLNTNDRDFSSCIDYAWSGAKPQIALAVQRAREIAMNGTSSIPLVAIAVTAR
jgi:UrcA family protein